MHHVLIIESSSVASAMLARELARRRPGMEMVVMPDTPRNEPMLPEMRALNCSDCSSSQIRLPFDKPRRDGGKFSHGWIKDR